MDKKDLELAGTRTIPWKDALPSGLTAQEVVFGRDTSGVGEVQVAVAMASVKPTKGHLDTAWRTRGLNTAMPVLVAAIHLNGVWLYDGREAPLGPIPISQAQRRLQAVLDDHDGIAAQQTIKAIQAAYSSIGTGGYVNQFLFATYYLEKDVKRRPDWMSSCASAEPLLEKRGKDLITNLGFEAEPVGNSSSSTLVLRAASGSRRAVAVLLDESELFDQKSNAYQLSPVAHGLEVASREEVPWLMVLRQSTLRLYPGRDGVGVGQRGQSETFFELDLSFIDSADAGLLTLIYSATALERGGPAEQILEGSARYAADLGGRLRDRVYDNVVPQIAIAIAKRLPQLGLEIDSEGVKVAYSLTLRVLFRLLFQAYGEDSALLPAGRNGHYDANSLQKFVEREMTTSPEDFSESASSIWYDLVQVWDAIYSGNPRWEVPAYGGSIFDPTTVEGALLRKLELPDSVLGPALQAMLTEVTGDGVPGPVDFRSLQVREFGTIYEGLLESSLSLAGSDLAVNRSGAYVPAKEGDDVAAWAGEPYFHSASGERKATGSYFTPKVIVDHLIERSITPALNAHLGRVKELINAGKDNEAATLFWDFKVADLAMGSAHFLVAAVDKIERGMRDFLTVTPVPPVRAELARLAEKAREELGADVEAAEAITEAQLLRRQVARRCIYGLDINPLAVELSRLALWIHTFVPGLPMSSLDHGLVLANSLTGIGTVEEALSALDPRRQSGSVGFFDSILIDELQEAKARLLDFANASEADKSEVEAGERLLAAAQAASATARGVFDAAVALRSGEIEPRARFMREDLDELLEDPAIRDTTKRLVPGHFPYLFPEVFLRDDPGFDAIVGNPPWDKVRWEAAPFWSKVSPGLMALPDTQRKARIDALRIERPIEAAREQAEMADRQHLQEYFKRVFEWRGGSHLELAQLMMERALKSLRPNGHLGLVLPRQALVLAGWKRLREVTFTNHAATLVQARNAGGWMFEGVDARYAVVLLSVGPKDDDPVRVAVVGSASHLMALDAAEMVDFSVVELQSLSDTMVVPWFESTSDRQVFDKIRRGARLSSGDGWIHGNYESRWDFTASGRDHSLSEVSARDGAWSIMMTRHVLQYGIASGIPQKQFVNNLEPVIALGRGIVREGTDAVASSQHSLIMIRRPSRSDDTRTLIAAALPAKGWLPNNGSVHSIHLHGAPPAEAQLGLLGLMNSNVADWWVRRFADRHVTAPVINNLPLPESSAEAISEIADRVVHLLVAAGYQTLAGGIDVEQRAAASSYAHESRDDHLAAIEGLVAFGHGLTEGDLAVIRSDFSAAGMPQGVFDKALIRLASLWEGNQ
ncbi:Eco57I restriction-modification methylase domain-containing protein [Homoserinimonas sp. A520]